MALFLGVISVANAQTGCIPVTLPWSEDFDSCGSGATLMPSCWSASHNYDLGAVPHVDTTVRYNGSASLMLYSGTLASSHYSIAIGPEVSVDLTSGVFARFHFFATSTAVSLEVGVCDDTNRYTRNFVPLDTVHVDQGRRWKEVVVDLGNYTGTGRRLAFRLQRALQAEPSQCFIDNLRLEGCGTTLPRAYHIGYNSLTVDWERYGAGSITLEYNGQTVANAVAPLTLTELTPLTEYTLSIGCDGGIRQEVTATTLAGPSLTTTYYRDHMTLTVAGDSVVELLPLPMEDIDIRQLTLAFLLHGDTSTRLVAGVMTYGGEPESFSPLDTLTPDGGWRHHAVSMASYAGTGRYIALMASGQGSLSIDHLRLAHCMIDSVRLYDLTDGSVTVAWDTIALTSDATVTIEYGPQGFAAGSGTTVTASTNPFVLSGLEPATDYDLLVAPACGDTPSAYDRHSITTFSHEVSVPYCMTFESETTLPQGWVCGQGSATLGTTAYQGSHGLHLAAQTLVTLPRIDITAGDTVLLEFYSYGNGTLEIGFMANPYGTFVPFDTLTGGNGWWRHLATLSIPSGRLLALRNTNPWDIDALALHRDVVITSAIGAIGKNTAQLTWQTLWGDSVEVEYRAVASATADFTPGTGTLVRGLDTLVLGELTPGTFYALHLRPVSDAAGCLYQSCHLQTAADAVAAPYCENFDNLNDLPTSWRRKSELGEYPLVSTERNRSPNKALRFSATATARTLALLPDFVSGSEHLRLAFWTNVTLHPEGAMLLVGHLSDIADIDSFVANDTLFFGQSERWEHHSVDLGTAHGQVALMLVGGSNGETRLFIDDLCVEPCLVDNIRVTHVDSASVTLQWASHEALVDITVAGNGTTVRDTIATTHVTFNGLTPNSPYTITLKALCDCGGGGATHYIGAGSTGSVATDHYCTFSINTRSQLYRPPYCLTFENLNTGTVPGGWLFRRGTASVSDRNYHSGSHSLIVNDSCYLVLPPMEMVSALTVSMHAYASNEAALASGALTIGVTENPDSVENFTVVDTLELSRVGEWQRLWSDLSSYAGDGHYMVLRVLAPGCSIFFDDLSVSKCAIGEAEVDENGVVSWQGIHAPAAVAIEYGLQGFPQGSGTQDMASTSPYSLQNLAIGENYDIYLTPVCGVDTNCISTRVTLGAEATTPYCEQFDLAPPSGMPTGWSIGRTYGNSPSIASGEGKSLLLRGHSNNSHRSIAVLPLLEGDDTLQLSLSLKAAGSNARLAIGHIASNADPNTFEITDTLVPMATTSWQRLMAVVSISDQRRLAVSCFSVNQSDAQIWIDSVAVTRGISPTLAATSARTLAVGGTTSYVEYGPQGFAQGSGTLACPGTMGLTLDGLTPEEEYWFYTREDSNTLTCMPPSKIRMPAEAALPYCQSDTLVERLQLPEMAIDSLRHLHLYLTVDGASQLEIGIMEHDGDWEHLSVVETLDVPDDIRETAHVSLATYSGRGRFVGLRALGGNVMVRSLTATACPWVTVEAGEGNSVMLRGHGNVEYGPANFNLGNGIAVTVTDSLRLPLDDTTLYDFYTLCNSAAPCFAPTTWQSTLTVELPYCVPLDDGMPVGWIPYSNALDNNTVHVDGGVLTMVAAPNRNIGVMLPSMTERNVVVDMEIWLSGNDIALLLGNDTVATEAGDWRRVRINTTHDGRLIFSAHGNGTVRLRNLIVNRCALPHEMTVGQPGGRGVELNWDTTEVEGPFFVEYRLAGSIQGVTVKAIASPLTLLLLPDTSYTLLLKCDSTGASCNEPFTITTLSDPQPLPYCTTFDISNLEPAPEGWYRVDDGDKSYLVMPQFDIATLQSLNILVLAQLQQEGQMLTLGTLRDAGDPETFDSLTSIVAEGTDISRLFHSLANYYGNGRFLALKMDVGSTMSVSHLSVDTCAAYNIVMTETETDHIVLSWELQGNPTVNVEYGPLGFAPGEGTLLTVDTPPLRIDSLAPLTDYAFLVSSQCDETSCRTSIVDTFLTFTPKGGSGCIDYTDLHASYVSCKYGSYSNPTEFTGVVDKGHLSPLSRHTVHFDTLERDARTGGLLRTVPEGEQASVRLGNWTSNINPQGESITYALTVDTNDFNLLVLRYAAVLQDPEHSAELQPRFRLQILNQNNDILDACSSADFIANPTLVGNTNSSQRWNLAANDVLWKDWTTVGVDLSAYAGQTIFIRLITNDCGEGSHFGYAYFTLGCSTKRMQTEGCSDVPNNRFTVPSGFHYRWYSNLDTTTISDSSSLWVPSDNSLIYYCQLSFVDNPNCNFTMSAFAGARFPLAIIDTAVTVANCEFDLVVTNRSTISGDGFTPIGTGESCETGLWILPDSTTSTANTLSIHLTDTGFFDITLVAGIADDQCIDTLHRSIHIVRPHPDALLTGRPRRCNNEPPDTLNVFNATTFTWSDNTTGPLILAPTNDTTITCYTVDTNGCRDTLNHTLHIFPAYLIHLDDSICNTESSYLWYDTLVSINQTESIISRTRLLSTHNQCDSLLSLNLTLMPTYDIHHIDTLCHDSELVFFDTLLTTTGDYLHTDVTDFGCDSMVTMHLTIIPRVYGADTLTVCDSMTWINHITYYRDTAGVTDTLSTSHGCDSVMSLLLTVNHSTYDLLQDTFCQGSQYLFRDHIFTQGGYYADTVPTVKGCDSVMAVNLVRLSTPLVGISHDYDCDSLYHHLVAHSDVSYIFWSSSPHDILLDGHEHDTHIDVNPRISTKYTLYVDYDSVPRCPATTLVSLRPETKPIARMKVNPIALVLPDVNFDAYDISAEYQERAWYINNLLQSETSRHLQGIAPEDKDTVKVTLIVDDGHCVDSTITLIPLLFSKLAAPNAFTPDQNDENSTFYIRGIGILQAEVSIFNRHGSLVFRSNDINKSWDGRNLTGENCPAGAYVWHIRYVSVTRPGAFFEEKGTVLLIR